MEALPPDILDTIASYCPQGDAVNLALSLRLAQQAVVTRLYSCIVLDPGPRALSGPYEIKLPEYGLDSMAVSVVRTAAGIKQCLKTLAAYPELAAKVRWLECLSNVPLSDATLRSLFSEAFVNLHRLAVLQWSACPELPLDILALLPNPQSLVVLEANLAVRPWQELPKLSFPGLKRLAVSPYLGKAFLGWLCSTVEDADELQDIWLSRFLDVKHEVGSGYAFVGLRALAEEHVSVVEHFFGQVAKRNLQKGLKPRFMRRIGLLETQSSPKDAETLAKAVNLVDLEEFELSGEPDPGSGHEFLSKIMHLTPQLKHLHLDWPVSPRMIVRYLDHHELQSLHLGLRSDPLAVMKGVSRQKMLRELKLTVKTRFQLSDLEPLQGCRSLESLCLPFSFESPTWRLAAFLPVLKHLELEYSPEGNINGGGSPAPPGLVTTGLLSMWNDEWVQPMQYSSLFGELLKDTCLDSVEINGQVHILRPRKQTSPGY